MTEPVLLKHQLQSNSHAVKPMINVGNEAKNSSIRIRIHEGHLQNHARPRFVSQRADIGQYALVNLGNTSDAIIATPFANEG
jgi:hypothetical protein